MSDHLLAVIACWLVALCGLAMFLRATTRYGLASAHAAVFVALCSLSAMALDHDHAPANDRLYVSEVGSQLRHAPGCPLSTGHILYHGLREAMWGGKKFPCTYCLLDEAKQKPGHGNEQHRGPDSGE